MDLEPYPSIKIRKTLIYTILLLLFDLLSLKTDINVPLKSTIIRERTLKLNLFFVGILSVTDDKKQDQDL